MQEDKFIGPFKVVGITETDIKTPLGSEVVKVLYENAPPEIMPKKAYDLLLTTTPVESSPTQEKRFDVMIPKIIEQMAEYDVKMIEVGLLLMKVQGAIKSHFGRASSYLWTGDDRNFIEGMEYQNFRTLIETDHILKTINKDNDITKKPKTDDKG